MLRTCFLYAARISRILPLVASTLSLAAPVSAQQTSGSIAGTIIDPLGARIAGAAVKLLRDGQVVKETQSDTRGNFSFDAVPEGRYRIQACFEGFQVRTTHQMFLAAAARTTLEVSLPLGPLETDVTVTAAANEVLPSQIGAPVTVLDAKTLEVIGKSDVLEALRLVPGSSLVQTGGRGGTTSVFIRGGNSNFNKMLIDGIPANDIGGGIDLSPFATTGVERIEVLRESNSVIAGTDALAGVISITSRRGQTRTPEATLSLDSGNLDMNRESASVGGVVQRFDYFSEFSHLGTDNNLPDNRYRNKTYAGRFGAAVGHNTDLSGTVRWIDKYYESPNGVSLYGTPDDAFQTNRMHLFGLGSQTQITDRWQGSIRVGVSDQRAHFVNPTLSGQNIGGVGFGDTVTITGANGYSATGRGVLDFGTYDTQSRSARQGVYGQTTYQLSPSVSLSGGGDYEREQAFTNPDADPTTTRHNGAAWLEGRGSLLDRVSITAGLGYAHIEGYASRYSPRLSVAAYLRKPTANEFWSDTRLTLNAGRGIKATSATTVDRSLYNLLLKTATGTALAANSGIGPIGPERGRNLDLGIEQGLWQGRARVRVAYFNNEFFDLVEFVSRNLLPQFGIAPDVAAAAGTGAYVNSQSFTAKGVEVSADAMFGRLRVAGSYTYLDAVITKSLSSSVTPQFNPLFPGIPIGGFTALVGQRPFRRPVNTGSLLLAYRQGPVDVALTGYFAGKADDSTFIVGSDINFGNTLLLPNRDLNFGYQKIDVSGSYRIHPRIKWYATVENVLDQHYEPTFGFPGLPINMRTGVAITVGGR
jgi:iron complex outermembrane receptor protein/vitamin B12 transporter